LLEIQTGVQPGVFDARDHQRGHGQIGIGAERRVTERVDQSIGDGHGWRLWYQKKGRGTGPALKLTVT